MSRRTQVNADQSVNKCFYLLCSDPAVVLDSDNDEDQPLSLDKRSTNFNISHSSIGRYCHIKTLTIDSVLYCCY